MAKKVNKKKVARQPRPLRIAALIISAIKDLKETKGSTQKKILGHITYASHLPVKRVKRQVNAALRRGVQYGILRRYRGHYFLPAGDELERANKMADRFARLPSPVQNLPIPNIPNPLPLQELPSKIKRRKRKRATRKTRKIRKPVRWNLKRKSKAYSLPVSTSPSLNNKLICTDDECSFKSDA